MQLAVISDIHANHWALETALHKVDERSADGIVFLGDYISDCPYPQKTMALLYEYREKYPCWFIRGNREDYILEYRKNPDRRREYSAGTGSLLYTYENLTEKDFAFFESMPICREIALKDCPTLTVCHGSPEKSKEWLLHNSDLIEHHLRHIEGKILLCGHTHRTEAHYYRGKTAIFCPSVGMPQDKNNAMRMLFLKCNKYHWSYELLPLPFDYQKTEAEFYESGLFDKAPIWSACVMKSLRDRRNYPQQCVSLAWRKAISDHYTGDAMPPEKYWIAAAKELNIID